MRKVLIISPCFAPINSADQHRVRQSLPYFEAFGWQPITLAVDPDRVEELRDPALLETIPTGASVSHVRAFDPRWTRKLGLGSLALRSLWFYREAGNRILERGDIDLVYFSTTKFPVAVLGAYWKRRFGVPYVIDMQDPWFTDYYHGRPKHERPAKYWFSYRLDKYLEPVAMRRVDAVISVSDAYCETLRERYPESIRPSSCAVIPFGGAERDFEMLDRIAPVNPIFDAGDGLRHVVYVGRGGHDMAVAAHAIAGALARGLETRPELFDRVRVHFVGTHYGRNGTGAKTIEPVGDEYGLAGRFEEHPGRVSYFTALGLLRDADMLLIPGSSAPGYTASKLYPYILSRRPILAVFQETSSVVDILRVTRAGELVTFAADARAGDEGLRQRVLETWAGMLARLPYAPNTDWAAFEPYTAREMTRRQVEVFDRVVDGARRAPRAG